MIKVLVVPRSVVRKTAAAELKKAPWSACLSFTLDASEIRESVGAKNGALVVIGPGSGVDVRVSPENLSSVGITIQQVMQGMNAPRRLVVEGFSELAVHAAPETVRRFAFFLTAGLRSWGVDAVFVVAKEASAGSVIPVLMQAADEVVSGKGQ